MPLLFEADDGFIGHMNEALHEALQDAQLYTYAKKKMGECSPELHPKHRHLLQAYINDVGSARYGNARLQAHLTCTKGTLACPSPARWVSYNRRR